MKAILVILLALLFANCAKKDDEKISDAIDMALSFLSNGNCSEALRVLDEVDNLNDNAIYLQVLASAHACKAGFDEVSFIGNDLTSMVTTSVNTIFKSLSIMSLSNDTEADTVGYTAINVGINVILNSTTGVPGQVARKTKFGTRKSADMGVQALVLSLVNLGKFLNYYGNVSAVGTKGGGTGNNSCFINYSDVRATALVGVTTGACTVANDGHAELDQTTTIGRRRLCEGLTFVTNIIDILENLDLSNSSTLSKLSEVSAKVSTFKTDATAAGLGTLISMTSVATCEEHLNTPANIPDFEYFYALIFESGLQ